LNGRSYVNVSSEVATFGNSEMLSQRPTIRDIIAMDWGDPTSNNDGISEGELAKMMGSVAGMGAVFGRITLAFGDAVGRSMGLKSSTRIERSCHVPYVAAVRSLLLALRAMRHGLAAAVDTPRGSFVEARLPTDMFSVGGTVQFEIVEGEDGSVTLSAQSDIKGQKYDWGKGKRTLNEVLDKAEDFARRLNAVEVSSSSDTSSSP
jgi:hypothetical protein